MRQKESDLIENLAQKSLSRRNFIRYSSIALSAAGIHGIPGCAGNKPKNGICLKPVLSGPLKNDKKVFQSSKLGNVKLENRILRSATNLGFGDSDYRPTKELASVYSELSKGGVGAIITGVVSIQKNGLLGIKSPHLLDSDDSIPAYKKLSDAAHRDNTPVFMQVGHAGRQTRRGITGLQPVAPSAIRDGLVNEEVPKALTEAEIEEMIRNFVLTIKRAKNSGFDGAQIHCAHGYLLAQFLSAHTNQRTDKWGGSLENRFRIVEKIFQEARKEVRDFTLIAKMNAYDFQPDGMRIEEAVKIAVMLQNAGCDGIEVSCGCYEDGFSIIRVTEAPVDALFKYSYKVKDMSGFAKVFASIFAPFMIDCPGPVNNYNVCAAEKIKQNVDIPVIAVGGIRNLPDIEQIIGTNMADYAAMSRPFIIEPDIVNRFKTKSHTESECISCGYCLIALDEIPTKCFYGEV